MNFLASREQLRASFIRWALICVPLCVLLGFLSGRLSGSDAGDPWFTTLVKPELYPPPAAFGIVWTALYAIMGLALAYVGSAWGARGRVLAIAAFAVQLLVNLAWSPVFFALHQMTVALAIIAILAVLVALTAWLFWRIRRAAGLLMLPYLAWVLFAGTLNYEILRLNPQADGADGASGASARVRIGD